MCYWEVARHALVSAGGARTRALPDKTCNHSVVPSHSPQRRHTIVLWLRCCSQAVDVTGNRNHCKHLTRCNHVCRHLHFIRHLFSRRRCCKSFGSIFAPPHTHCGLCTYRKTVLLRGAPFARAAVSIVRRCCCYLHLSTFSVALLLCVQVGLRPKLSLLLHLLSLSTVSSCEACTFQAIYLQTMCSGRGCRADEGRSSSLITCATLSIGRSRSKCVRGCVR